MDRARRLKHKRENIKQKKQKKKEARRPPPAFIRMEPRDELTERQRAFQRFVWEEMRAVRGGETPFKEAMIEAGRRWENGEPISEKDKLALAAWQAAK